MSKTGVGLDIGTSSVKLVELNAQGGQNITVNQFGMTPLPEGALNGGVIKDQFAVTSAH